MLHKPKKCSDTIFRHGCELTSNIIKSLQVPGKYVEPTAKTHKEEKSA